MDRLHHNSGLCVDSLRHNFLAWGKSHAQDHSNTPIHQGTAPLPRRLPEPVASLMKHQLHVSRKPFVCMP